MSSATVDENQLHEQKATTTAAVSTADQHHDDMKSKTKSSQAPPPAAPVTSSATPADPTPVNAPPPSAFETKPDTLSVGNLLRLHLVEANLQKEYDHPYAIVTVGKNAAKTRELKKGKDLLFDEHFVVEYDPRDTESEVVVTLFDKGRLTDSQICEWRQKISEVKEPADYDEIQDKDKKEKKKGLFKKKDKKPKETWYTETPQKVPLHEKKNSKTEKGTLSLCARREQKVTGMIEVEIREAVLPGSDDEAKFIIRLLNQDRISDSVRAKKNVYHWKNKKHTVEANNLSNVRDIFIEFMRNDQVLGETRITLFDVKRNAIKGKLSIVHFVNGAKTIVGEAKVTARLLKDSNKTSHDPAAAAPAAPAPAPAIPPTATKK